MSSRARFQRLLEQCEPGPVADRLQSMGERIDAGVLASVTIATRAQTASRTVSEMELDEVHHRLKDARRRLVEAQEIGTDAELVEQEVAMLADQHSALNDLHNMVDDAVERLRNLDMRLDAVVARAAQLVLRPDAAQAAAVESELAGVVGELDALRTGFDVLDSLGP